MCRRACGIGGIQKATVSALVSRRNTKDAPGKVDPQPVMAAPIGLGRMLRIHFVQHGFKLAKLKPLGSIYTAWRGFNSTCSVWP